MRERICSPDIKLLSVSLRPFYLPREFPQIFITVVYIHPKANSKSAAGTVSKVLSNLKRISPDAPNFVLGDFNNCDLKKTLCDFYQYVNCHTRYDKTLDLCYGSIKGALKDVAGPPIGFSDHNVVHLLPAYKSVLRREKTLERKVQVWSEDSSLALQSCFDCTDWSVFQDASENIDELTEVVCGYVSFCTDMIIPKKTVIDFPNNKPWLSSHTKVLLNS